jgi:hypothetical protein
VPVPSQDAPAILVDVMRGVLPEVRECIEAWMEQDPTLSGRVVLEATVGPEGLGEVWVVEHSDVPLGPLSCFGAALYEASWPAFAEPTTVTFPFTFHAAGDTGE